MPYIKNTWVDQNVERPKTYEMTNNSDGSVTLIDSFGLVSEMGTPVNADNMNHIEEGIAACDIRKFDITEEYEKGEWVTGIVDGEKSIYESLIDKNIGNQLTDENTWAKVEMGGGASRNVGEIVYSLLPQTDAGLHLLDGTLINGIGSYRAFVGYIANLYGDGTNIPSYFTTEEDWQASVTNYGVCGKFVFNKENYTVRLPKVTGLLEGTLDANALGDLIQAGLPNLNLSTVSAGAHTHTRGTMDIKYTRNGVVLTSASSAGSNGALQWSIASTGGNNSGSYTRNILNEDFAASRAWTGSTSSDGAHTHDINVGNSIVGTTDTVQPQTIKGFMYLVIANSVKTDIEVDIDNVMTDLNGKADTDLSNLTEAGEKHFDDKYLNYNQLTNCILEAPNGLLSISSDPLKITVPAGMKLLISNGRNPDKTIKNIEYVIPDNLESTDVPIEPRYVAVNIDTGVIFTVKTTNVLSGKDANKPNTLATIQQHLYFAEDTKFIYLTSNQTTTATWEVVKIAIVGIYDVNKTSSTTSITVTPYQPVSLAKEDDIDGKWINSSYTVFQQVALGTTEKTYNLANYLPKDNNIYEIALTGTSRTNGSTHCQLTVHSSIQSYMQICGGTVISSGNSVFYGNGNLYIGTDRVLYINADSANTAAIGSLVIQGYRKVR